MKQLLTHLKHALLTLFALGCAAAMAANDSPQTSQTYWMDPSGQATIHQLNERQFQSFNGLLAKGFTSAALWIRVDTSTWLEGDPNDLLVVRVRPSFLDHVTLYVPHINGETSIHKSGDMVPWQNSSYPSLNLGYTVKRSELSKTIYIRVQTTSTLIVNVDIMRASDAALSDRKQELWYAVTLGMIAVFWCWIFISWLRHRDSLRQIFAIKQLFGFFYTMGFFGYFRIFLSDIATPEQINFCFNICVIGVTWTSFWYEFKFISQYKLPIAFKALMRIALIIPAVSLSLIFLGHTQQGLQLNMHFLGVAILLLLFGSLALLMTPPGNEDAATPYLFGRPILFFYYSFLSLALLINVLSAIGINIGLEFGLHNFVLHGIVSGIMMTVLLQIRAYKIEEENQKTSIALYLAQKQMVIDKTKRDEQTQFLHMLTHELKTPLSVISLVLKSSAPTDKTLGYANRAVEDMKSIIARCVDVDRIDDGHVQVQVSTFNLHDLIQEIIQSLPAASQGVEVSIANDLTLHSDAQYVRIILGNLIENAMRYGAADQPVSVAISAHHSEHPGQLGIEVCNAPGTAGWPDAQQVFNKYYRSPKALNQSGTGLGLFLAYRLATLLGGRCAYAPTSDHVRFVLWLPA